MLLKSIIVGCAALVAVAASGPATAQSCVGFTDVPGSDAFCPNVEWIRNRAITLGCTATAYCPSENVSRVQMAAFLNRMGTALTPVTLTPGTAAAAPVNLNAGPILCQTSAYAVTGFPRRAYVQGITNLSSPAPSGVDVMAQVVMSTTGGTSWTPIANTDQYATLYPGATPGNHVALAPFGWVDVNVGETVRFGLQVGRFDVGTSNVTASCRVSAQVANRNSTSPPLDP